MAKTKRAAANRGRTRVPAPTNTAVKALAISFDDVKYYGYEPEWAGVELTEDNRKSHMLTAFNWYNHSFGPKDAKAMILEYLKLNKRPVEFKAFKKVKDGGVPNAYGYLARMTLMGWTFTEEDQQRFDAVITKAIAEIVAPVVQVDEEAKPVSNKPNIQEIMRERIAEAGGEIEGMLDDYITAGSKARHNHSPIEVLKEAKVLPAHVPGEITYWTSVLNEFQAAYKTADVDLKEAYASFNKIQLRNVIKFLELIIADYAGYVALKKAAKAPRKRKVKTPEQLAARMKYQAKEPTLKLESIKPAKIVGAKEVFAYNVAKRKLMYFVADEYAGELTVRNSTIVGFDVTKSKQKTIRKPQEQIKAFMAASRPNTRKLYTQNKSVEINVSGRFNENVIILKVF